MPQCRLKWSLLSGIAVKSRDNIHCWNRDFQFQFVLLPILVYIGIEGEVHLKGESNKQDDEVFELWGFFWRHKKQPLGATEPSNWTPRCWCFRAARAAHPSSSRDHIQSRPLLATSDARARIMRTQSGESDNAMSPVLLLMLLLLQKWLVIFVDLTATRYIRYAIATKISLHSLFLYYRIASYTATATPCFIA